ncbi:hypothetical protein PHISCL_10993 [Aspergillus sclerotialis]|uniref:Uncharacterized protein n=1 Tax=Aspergillus sclerotialis TaxID=2070753 RepID=A0A3A2Z1Q3_9EURO|nr:hypothetical protein PHISCL_10993 [Aspergillus sclerotialis]
MLTLRWPNPLCAPTDTIRLERARYGEKISIGVVVWFEELASEGAERAYHLYQSLLLVSAAGHAIA